VIAVPLIELDGVSVIKPNCILLDKINLRVSRNEFVGIIGPNIWQDCVTDIIAGFDDSMGICLFRTYETRNRSIKAHTYRLCPQSFEIDPPSDRR
jgi:ABC-type branched-subunit amino acid transport system ATPase component